MTSIVETYRRQAERIPDQRLYAFLDIHGRITHGTTYAAFAARFEVIAGVLHGAGLRPGERVLLAYPPGVEMMAALLGCVRLGLIPVPISPPTPRGFEAGMKKLVLIARDCGAEVVLTTRAYAWSLRMLRVRRRVKTFSFRPDEASPLRWIHTDTITSAPSAPTPPPSEVAFLQYTSGSTGSPKGVIVTHGNLLANAPAVVGHNAIGVSWLPQYHDMGLIGYYLFFGLLGCTTYGFSPLDFLQRPALWFETVSRFRGTAITGPNFAFAYCLRPDKVSDEELRGLDLSSLRYVMSASEPVRPDIARAFIDRYTKLGMDPRAYFVAYGLAENTLGVTSFGRRIVDFDSQSLAGGRPEPARIDRPSRELMSCGRPIKGVEVAIADDAGGRLREGQVGEIWARGTSKCAGYWGQPERSREVFERRLTGDADADTTWLATGDLGFVHEDEVFVCGRKKDLIIVRGRNIYPQDVERLVELDPAIRPGCVAAFGIDDGTTEQVVVVAELRSDSARPDGVAIHHQIQTSLGAQVYRLVGVRARTIPKTSSGKIARHRARELLGAGDLQILYDRALAPAPSAAQDRDHWELPAPFEGLFRRFGLDGIDPERGEETTLGECGLDSIRLAELGADVADAIETLGWPQLAAALDLRLLQRLTVTELAELVRTVADQDEDTIRGSLAMLHDLRQAHVEVERMRMQEEATLSDELAAMIPGRVEIEAGAPSVLLTGGTGFFGPFLLRSLLEQRGDTLQVLVRSEDPAAGHRRLIEGLRTIGSSSRELREWGPRIHAVCGDLEQRQLGLDPSDWGRLAAETTEVLHNGAMVNYVYDYAGMRAANVGGTEEILRLCASGRPKVLNHISTTFIFGWSVKDTLFEHDRNEEVDRLDFGYAQTKWVSEQLVHEAMDRGLRGRVFRPALLTPSVDGRGSNFDIAIRLLAFMIKYGLGTSAGNQVSFCPADIAACNIVAICGDPASLDRTFNVTRDEYASMGHITQLLGDMSGAGFEHLQLSDFVPALISRCGRDDILFPLLNFLVRSNANISAMEFKRYDNSNFKTARDSSRDGRADPSLREVVRGIFLFMERHGLLPTQGLST